MKNRNQYHKLLKKKRKLYENNHIISLQLK